MCQLTNNIEDMNENRIQQGTCKVVETKRDKFKPKFKSKELGRSFVCYDGQSKHRKRHLVFICHVQILFPLLLH